MSTFVYSTQSNLDGPWLIDRAALGHLGNVIDAISGKFSVASNDCIEAELSKILERYPNNSSEEDREKYREDLVQRYKLDKKITLSLSNSKYIEAESVEELLSLPELIDELPIGFEVEIKSILRSVTIKFKKVTFSNIAKLDIRTSPETDELARVAFVDLQNWAATYQAPLWQRLWANNYGLIVFFWIVALLVGSQITLSHSDKLHQDLRPVAIQLLKDGISNENFPKAIELLLRNEFKEPIVEHKNQAPKWFKYLVFGGFTSVIILFFRPSLEIGVGRSVVRLKRWRLWTKFVGIMLPGFISVSILWPYLAELLGFPH